MACWPGSCGHVGIFTFGDDAAYLLLSRSLRALSYREVQFVGNPIAARFPPDFRRFWPRSPRLPASASG